jgi:hypothetical protein
MGKVFRLQRLYARCSFQLPNLIGFEHNNGSIPELSGKVICKVAFVLKSFHVSFLSLTESLNIFFRPDSCSGA